MSNIDKKFIWKPRDQESIKKHVADSPWRENRELGELFPGFLINSF